MSYQVLFNKSLPLLNGGDCAMSIAKLRFFEEYYRHSVIYPPCMFHHPSSVCLLRSCPSGDQSSIQSVLKVIDFISHNTLQHWPDLFFALKSPPTHYTHNNISFELAGFLTVFPWSPTWYKYRCGCFRYSTSSSAVVEKPQKVNNK